MEDLTTLFEVRSRIRYKPNDEALETLAKNTSYPGDHEYFRLERRIQRLEQRNAQVVKRLIARYDEMDLDGLIKAYRATSISRNPLRRGKDRTIGGFEIKPDVVYDFLTSAVKFYYVSELLKNFTLLEEAGDDKRPEMFRTLMQNCRKKYRDLFQQKESFDELMGLLISKESETFELLSGLKQRDLTTAIEAMLSAEGNPIIQEHDIKEFQAFIWYHDDGLLPVIMKNREIQDFKQARIDMENQEDTLIDNEINGFEYKLTHKHNLVTKRNIFEGHIYSPGRTLGKGQIARIVRADLRKRGFDPTCYGLSVRDGDTLVQFTDSPHYVKVVYKSNLGEMDKEELHQELAKIGTIMQVINKHLKGSSEIVEQ
ncbi:hypothetical protein ACFL2V_21965 [Pseudomonadota bacterium]